MDEKLVAAENYLLLEDYLAAEKALSITAGLSVIAYGAMWNKHFAETIIN